MSTNPDGEPEQEFLEDEEPGTSQQIELLDAKARYLDAQTRAQDSRTRGRQTATLNVLRVIATVMWAAAVATWLGFVLVGVDESRLTAVSALALVVTNVAVAFITRGGGQDKDV